MFSYNYPTSTKSISGPSPVYLTWVMHVNPLLILPLSQHITKSQLHCVHLHNITALGEMVRHLCSILAAQPSFNIGIGQSVTWLSHHPLSLLAPAQCSLIPPTSALTDKLLWTTQSPTAEWRNQCCLSLRNQKSQKQNGHNRQSAYSLSDIPSHQVVKYQQDMAAG